MSVFSVRATLCKLDRISPSDEMPLKESREMVLKESLTPVETAERALSRLGVNVKYVTNDNDSFKAVSTLIDYPGILGCDIETTPKLLWKNHPKAGLDPYLAEIRLLQFATDTEVYVFDMNHIPLSHLEKLWLKPLVFHNATFDVKFLLHAGVRPARVGCTKSMDLILKGGGKWIKLSDLCEERLELQISKEEQLSDWSINELSSEQITYAALDAIAVKLLCDNLLKEIRERNMVGITTIFQRAIPAIAAMELAGIPFDWKAHQNLVTRWAEEEKILSLNIQSALQIEDMTSTKEIQQKFEKYFHQKGYDISKGKNDLPKLGKTELARFKDDVLIKKYLEHNCLKSRLSTFGDTLGERSNPLTKRVHPNFSHGGARTGRFASSSPNTQNFPNGEFRKLIAPNEGRVFVVADYSQIELRLLAIVAKEENMLTAYRKREDLHRLTASKILHVHPEKVTKEQRTCAKAVNFGFIYGQREGGFMRVAKNDYGLEVSYKEAKQYRNAFFEAYPAIAKWHKEVELQIQKTGKIKTLNGWERDFRKEIDKIVARKESLLQRKVSQREKQKLKIQDEEQILKRHRERMAKDPKSTRVKEMFDKKEAYIAELKKRHQATNQECYILNARISNSKKERNILMIPRILEEKCNILFAAFNLPIQGLGCELMVVALAKVFHRLENSKANIINCVHDEIVIECDSEEASRVTAALTHEMEAAFTEMFPEYTDTISGLVEAKIAQNWGEAK